MKKKELEILLQSLGGFEKPKAELEQYGTPANIAASILFMAYELGDVESKSVAELGSGSGIFSIGSCLLGASEIHAVELDKDAILVLNKNIQDTNCSEITVHHEAVSNFSIAVHTVFQNVPFGAQKRHADLPFIKKAMELGNVVYALHNGATRDFVMRNYERLGGKITHISNFEFYIPRIYNFHRRERVKRSFLFLRVATFRDNLK